MWQDRAACKDADSSIFLSGVASRIEKAKSICATCSVVQDCLEFAIRNEDFEPLARISVNAACPGVSIKVII